MRTRSVCERISGAAAFPCTDGNGVWEITFGPVPPGAYRYVFSVDGASNLQDPRNTSVSQSNTQNWSMFYVPGPTL